MFPIAFRLHQRIYERWIRGKINPKPSDCMAPGNQKYRLVQAVDYKPEVMFPAARRTKPTTTSQKANPATLTKPRFDTRKTEFLARIL